MHQDRPHYHRFWWMKHMAKDTRILGSVLSMGTCPLEISIWMMLQCTNVNAKTSFLNPSNFRLVMYRHLMNTVNLLFNFCFTLHKINHKLPTVPELNSDLSNLTNIFQLIGFSLYRYDGRWNRNFILKQSLVPLPEKQCHKYAHTNKTSPQKLGKYTFITAHASSNVLNRWQFEQFQQR